MRMARVNVYLPDHLAAQAKAAGLNVSGLTREAIVAALAARRVDAWLEDIGSSAPLGVDQYAIDDAIAAAKDEFGSDA
jgi:post-segregation antitoxin (ccd killing protein)